MQQYCQTAAKVRMLLRRVGGKWRHLLVCGAVLVLVLLLLMLLLLLRLVLLLLVLVL